MHDSPATPPRLLHHFFERSAKLYPNRIAVDVPPGPEGGPRSSVSYRELNSEAEALAANIGALAKADSLIAILLPRNSHRLYASQLGVLKAGGAFTCIDPSFPDSHIQAVLDDAEAPLLLTDDDGLLRISQSGLRVQHALSVSKTGAATKSPHSAPLSEGTVPENLCYVIYTSGTTGTPKGVLIEHRSVVNLVASDIEEFQLSHKDRVGQGSSAAYDSSIEEVWLAFAVGATLVVIDDQTSRMGPDLVGWLRHEKISVFCPPPTLLRTTGCQDPKRELPDLRLLYVGGEALTDDLVDRWATGRRLVNGYGPTECTITVVRGDVQQGRPVTIGWPVPGHTAWALDADLKPVEDGHEGELCISGIGLARGYRNRPALTMEKFPTHPSFGRIYRTGDLVSRDVDGQFTYLGRIDAQVKLRGYRVELEAVETSLSILPGVRESACRVQGEGAGQLLAAHVVPIDSDSPPDFASLKNALRLSLPSYMVPSRFGLVESLPRSVGGKVDRKKLPELSLVASTETGEPIREITLPSNSTEALIVAAFGKALDTTAEISTDDDFFIDLSGDSLSAVAVICSLREHAETAWVTTRDLYLSRTAIRLAERLMMVQRRQAVRLPFGQVPNGHTAYPRTVTVAQTLWLLLQLVTISAVSYIIAFELLPSLLSHLGLIVTLLLEPLLAMSGVILYVLCSIGLTVGLKWVLIGKYKSMRSPVWSGYYLRHWIVINAARTIPWNILAGTALYGSVLRALGAKVGQRVHIHRGVNLQNGGWDLLSIGDDVTLASEAHIGLVEFHSGCLWLGPVTIGNDATIDIRASLSGHTIVERGGYLTALSWLASGERISEGEMWNGVPAARTGQAPTAPMPNASNPLHPALYTLAQLAFAGIAHVVATLPLLMALFATAIVFGLNSETITYWLSNPMWNFQSFALVLAASVVWVPFALALKAMAVRWLCRVRPTILHRWSLPYILVAHKANEVESAGRWLSGTLFWPLWLRLAGMHIGTKCEISTIIGVIPECLSVGAESFFADGIYFGGVHIYCGTVTIERISLGRGTFLGNHVVIPGGAQLPEELFVGVCTVANSNWGTPGSGWFGHPPMELPRREVISINRNLTHNPGILRYTSRLFWETLRFALPCVPLSMACIWYWLMSVSAPDGGLAERILLLAPAVTLATILIQCCVVIGLKWALLGRAKAGQHPLWSCWCSRWDFLYVAWQFYAVRYLASLEGTLLLAMYLRAMGVRIGRQVVLGPGFVQVADPDMIVIEDKATVCANYQAHSFEDRVLKLAPVVVRRGATVGESAVVFYGADIGAEAWVTPNSVIMKNEFLAPQFVYGGCPVQALDVTPASLTYANSTNQATVQQVTTKTRYLSLDIARGLAVLGMIFMHFVSAETGQTGIAAIASGLASFLEGKAAALFCILAGMTWELQAQHAKYRTSSRSSWYVLRRALALAVVGVAFHILIWPTEILIPFALMMLISSIVRRYGIHALLQAVSLCLALIPVVLVYFSAYTQTDWNADGSHLTDSELGWATLRYLILDGHYPLVPWLAFPLLGMVLMAKYRDGTRPIKVWFAPSLTITLLAHAYVYWSQSNEETLGTLGPFLTSTWLPTSLPFVLTTGSCAIAIISGIAWLYEAIQPKNSMAPVRWLSLVGRSSLTHYLLHLCLVYAPLKALLGHEEWSVTIGLWAFAGYIIIAVPLTVLWFRRFHRGPAEAAWGILSGQ